MSILANLQPLTRIKLHPRRNRARRTLRAIPNLRRRHRYRRTLRHCHHDPVRLRVVLHFGLVQLLRRLVHHARLRVLQQVAVPLHDALRIAVAAVLVFVVLVFAGYGVALELLLCLVHAAAHLLRDAEAVVDDIVEDATETLRTCDACAGTGSSAEGAEAAAGAAAAGRLGPVCREGDGVREAGFEKVLEHLVGEHDHPEGREGDVQWVRGVECRVRGHGRRLGVVAIVGVRVVGAVFGGGLLLLDGRLGLRVFVFLFVVLVVRCEIQQVDQLVHAFDTRVGLMPGRMVRVGILEAPADKPADRVQERVRGSTFRAAALVSDSERRFPPSAGYEEQCFADAQDPLAVNPAVAVVIVQLEKVADALHDVLLALDPREARYDVLQRQAGAEVRVPAPEEPLHELVVRRLGIVAPRAQGAAAHTGSLQLRWRVRDGPFCDAGEEFAKVVVVHQLGGWAEPDPSFLVHALLADAPRGARDLFFAQALLLGFYRCEAFLAFVENLVEPVVYIAEVVSREPLAFGTEVPDGRAFGERFDGGEDAVLVFLALVGDGLLRDPGELAECDDHELLEAGDGPELLVVASRMGALVEPQKDGEADLEEDLRTLEEEDVEDSEGKDQRHGIYKEGEEPRQGYDGQLDVGLDEVLPQDGHGLLDEGLEDPLVEQGAVHGLGVVTRHEPITERGQQEERLGLRHWGRRHSGNPHEKSCNDNVHGLAVSDVGIAPAVGAQDSTQSADALLALKSGILGQAAIEVLFDLVYGEGMAAGELGESIFSPEAHLAPVAQLFGVAGVSPDHAEAGVGFFLDAVLGLAAGDEPFGVAAADEHAQVLHFAHLAAEVLLEGFAELLAGGAEGIELEGELLVVVPCCDGEGEEVAPGVETFDAADGDEGGRAGGGRGGGGEAEEGLGEVEAAKVVLAGGQAELAGDDGEGVFRVRETKVGAEEVGGGLAVGGGGAIDLVEERGGQEVGIDQGRGLGEEGGEGEHVGSSGQAAPRVTFPENLTRWLDVIKEDEYLDGGG
ncbi:hypothetical protein Dda_4912 [Drechslerella dactyloides]|uniref:Uncharacterized protein n=1 Tax=Drechslerella dactyloides TaxID=74499 RepID=A0AAD6J012_DREDA|nr:hypothetical protein Dda_4912 [Drechslerella dactyloides]